MVWPYATRRSRFGDRAFNSASGLVEYGIAQPLAISLHTTRPSNTAIEFYYYIYLSGWAITGHFRVRQMSMKTAKKVLSYLGYQRTSMYDERTGY